MPNLSLGTMRDYWKNVSDWVKGEDQESAPKVQLTGSIAYEQATDLLKMKLENIPDVNIMPRITDTKQFRRNGEVVAGTNELLFNTTKQIIIHDLLVSFDVNIYQTRIILRSGVEAPILFRAISTNGVNQPSDSSLYPLPVESGQFPLVESVIYDETNNKYLIRLKPQHSGMEVRGFRVDLQNNDTVSHNVAINLYYSEVE